MSQGSRLAVVGALLAGLAVGHLWGGATNHANAQPPARAADHGRYWASSWATNVAHGVYVVDTQTGEVFSVVNEGRPTSLGKPTSK
jgi:hypothetical protein